MREAQKRVESCKLRQVELQDRMTAILGELEDKATELTDEQVTALKGEYVELEKKFDAVTEDMDIAQRLMDREQAMAEARSKQNRSWGDEGVSGSRIEVGKASIENDRKYGFEHLGHFATAVQRATVGQGVDRRLSTMAAITGMGQQIGSDGGFLVPPQFSQNIWDSLNNPADSLLARTDQYTVTGESLTFNANAETNRATGSRYGGIRGYWIAEADQVTASRPKFRQVKLEPQQCAVLVYVTDKLLNNAGQSLEQYLTRAASDELNFKIGDAIINGTGAGQPLGILGHASSVSVSKETGQAAATIVAANINKMWSRLHTRANNAVWLINRDIIPQLMTLNASAGVGGTMVWLPPSSTGQDSYANAPHGTLLGRPIVPIEYAATLGTVGDIMLADLSYYAAGVRGGGAGVQTAMSMHLRFDYAETAFRFITSVDGQPWLAAPITPYKGTSNTLSPFVTLATRA